MRSLVDAPFPETEQVRASFSSVLRSSLHESHNFLQQPCRLTLCRIESLGKKRERLRRGDAKSHNSEHQQHIVGRNRDSGRVAHLFDENNIAVRRMIAEAIRRPTRRRKPIGICGQAPSDFPEFSEWLVELGIDSISLT
jgi:hypothetical protein